LDGVWFQLVVALVAVLMAIEWVTIVHRQHPGQFALHIAAALCGTFLPLAQGLAAALVAIAVLAGLAAGLAHLGERGGPFWRYVGVPYVSLPAAALVVLRHDADLGFAAIIWVMLIVWAADSLAYFAGRTIGGPKLAPRLSPRKTWAGLAGAMTGSAAASLALGTAMSMPRPVLLAFLAAAVALVEQAGDLFKSAMKRRYGVKDSGTLIPGHGGVIDRVDGLIAVAMVAALIGVLRAGVDGAGAGLLIW
jgi:phosphatidate cytidylyltransferase